MGEGVRTLIRTPAELDARLAMVRKDCAVILQHGPCLVSAATFTPRGTLEQNALFHLLCEHIAAWWTGRHPSEPTSKERVKTSMKAEYGVILTEYCPLTDKRKPRLASWSEYSKTQRCALITATLAWMAEHGCPDLPGIPDETYAQYREVAA